MPITIIILLALFAATGVALRRAAHRRDNPPPPPRPVQLDMPGKTPSTVLAELMLNVIPVALRNGYQVASQSEAGVVLSRTRLANGAVAVAILLFPLGLVALLAKQTDTLTFTLTPAGEDTAVTITGLKPRDGADMIRHFAPAPAITVR